MARRRLRRSINKRLARVLFAGRGLDLENLHQAVAVYPDQRLIYNRIKKSGNTRIVAFLNDQFRGDSFESSRRLKAALVRPFDLSVRDLRGLESFYSFTFVRNPYGRVLSAYLDKLATRRGTRQKPKRDGRPGHHAFPGYGENSPEGFARFLDYLDTGGLYANRHWWPQADLLFQPADRFGFIGHLERMVEDMGRVMSDLGRDPACAEVLGRPHRLEEGRRQTGTAEREAAFYTARGREIVARLYARDFALFGYTP